MADLKKEEEQYLAEFSLLSCRSYHSMADLTAKEQGFWHLYLKNYGLGEAESDANFFGEEDHIEFSVNLDEGITIETWVWQGKVLINIYSYPGDSCCGAIFYDDKLYRGYAEGNIEEEGVEGDLLSGLLGRRLTTFQHLLNFDCREKENSLHEPCRKAIEIRKSS